jgi:hypothetical protein
MFATSHVLAGVIIGAVDHRHPVRAFGLGVLSHVAMDLAPHWGRPLTPEEFLRVARRDGILALAALGVAVAAGGQARPAILAGALGAVVLDADKPARHFLGRSCFPSTVDRFHDAIQNEAPNRLGGEILAGLTLAALAIALSTLPHRFGATAGRRA